MNSLYTLILLTSHCGILYNGFILFSPSPSFLHTKHTLFFIYPRWAFNRWSCIMWKFVQLLFALSLEITLTSILMHKIVDIIVKFGTHYLALWIKRQLLCLFSQKSIMINHAFQDASLLKVKGIWLIVSSSGFILVLAWAV